jgi:hypothetical protein
MQVPSWPSGHVKLDGDVLEFGAGELNRVPVASFKNVEVREKAGRLSLKLEYTAGLNNVKTGAWVEKQHAAELDEIVAALRAGIS